MFSFLGLTLLSIVGVQACRATDQAARIEDQQTQVLALQQPLMLARFEHLQTQNQELQLEVRLTLALLLASLGLGFAYLVWASRRRIAQEAALVELSRLALDRGTRLDLALESFGMGEAAWEAQTGHLKASPRFLSLLELDPGLSPCLANCEARIHPGDLERIQAELQEGLGKGGLVDTCFRVPLAEGSLRWLRFWGRGRYGKEAALEGVDGIVMDVTDPKLEETRRWQLLAKMEDSQAFLNAVVENLPAMVYVKDAVHLRFVSINKAGEDLTGYKREELLGHSDADLFPDSRASSYMMSDRAILKGGQTVDFPEVPFETRERGIRLFHTRKVSVLGPNHEPTFLLGISEDITERVETQRALLELAAQLENRVDERTRQLKEANRELEAFAFTVSHDLRAPLRHMEGFAALMVRHQESLPGGLDEKGRHYLNRIMGASQAMSSLIEDLLTLSRVARQEMLPNTVDLDRMVATICMGFPPASIWERGPLGKVTGDLCLLQHAFENLLGNAMKFTRLQANPRIWVRRAGLKDGRTIFEVGDNGVGFDPAYAEQLFGVFQRLHPREDFEGSGIGLAIVAQVVQRHGGEVWAESQPNEGARFFLTLAQIEEGI